MGKQTASATGSVAERLLLLALQRNRKTMT